MIQLNLSKKGHERLSRKAGHVAYETAMAARKIKVDKAPHPLNDVHMTSMFSAMTDSSAMPGPRPDNHHRKMQQSAVIYKRTPFRNSP